MTDRLSKPIVAPGARTDVAEPVSPVSAAVAARLMDEGLLSLVQIAAFLPPVRGKRVSTSSVFRWITKGKHGVKLEGIRLHGGGYFSSKAALARFAAAVTQAERA